MEADLRGWLAEGSVILIRDQIGEQRMNLLKQHDFEIARCAKDDFALAHAKGVSRGGRSRTLRIRGSVESHGALGTGCGEVRC